MSVQDTLKRMDNEPTGMLRHTYEIPEDPMTGVWWAEAVMVSIHGPCSFAFPQRE